MCCVVLCGLVVAVLIFAPALTHRQDWSCEACFGIYPLYQAILLYLIDLLLLDANVLRDSILVSLSP